MRHREASWTAIEAALEPHQLRTLMEYANAKGVANDEPWRDPVCCAVGAALAIENAVSKSMSNGSTEKQALVQAAIRFDLDIETLLRERRRRRHDSPA